MKLQGELAAYIQSPKFSSPGELTDYVNRNDITPRLALIFDILNNQADPSQSIIGQGETNMNRFTMCFLVLVMLTICSVAYSQPTVKLPVDKESRESFSATDNWWLLHDSVRMAPTMLADGPESGTSDITVALRHNGFGFRMTELRSLRGKMRLIIRNEDSVAHIADYNFEWRGRLSADKTTWYTWTIPTPSASGNMEILYLPSGVSLSRYKSGINIVETIGGAITPPLDENIVLSLDAIPAKNQPYAQKMAAENEAAKAEEIAKKEKIGQNVVDNTTRNEYYGLASEYSRLYSSIRELKEEKSIVEGLPDAIVESKSVTDVNTFENNTTVGSTTAIKVTTLPKDLVLTGLDKQLSRHVESIFLMTARVEELNLYRAQNNLQPLPWPPQ